MRLITYPGFESPSLRHLPIKGCGDSQNQSGATQRGLGHSRLAFAAILAAILVSLTACGGGGGDDSGNAVFVPKHGNGPNLRPCETTGPTAPPCPASGAQ